MVHVISTIRPYFPNLENSFGSMIFVVNGRHWGREGVQCVGACERGVGVCVCVCVCESVCVHACVSACA